MSERCGGCAAFSRTLTLPDFRRQVSEEIRAGRHPSQGVFTRFDPKTIRTGIPATGFTRVQRAGCTGKTIREAAQGTDSLELLLDVLTEDPYTAVISLGRRPGITPRPGRLRGPAGGYHRSGYLDPGLRRGPV